LNLAPFFRFYFKLRAKGGTNEKLNPNNDRGQGTMGNNARPRFNLRKI
jgi:hypothetical protein